MALLVLLPTGPRLAREARVPDDIYKGGVVGLQVTYQNWDEDRPWAKHTPKSRSVSGVMIDATHILTTADIIDQATFLQLRTFGRSRQVEPRIVLVDPGINLALLEIVDPVSLDGLAPVPIASETPTSGDLRTVRWRGQQLESAVSRVLRFDVSRAWGSRVKHAFLYMRTDVARGGWAEPVFDDGKLVGITVSQSDQVSRAIPVEILRAFLERAADPGGYVGFPAVGVFWQVNRDPAVSHYLGQQGEPRGVLVRQVPWGSSGCGVVKPRDILLEIDGYPIDAEGFTRHPRLGRIQFGHILTEFHRPGDLIDVRVLRHREEKQLTMTLREYPLALDLIPARRAGPPAYVIVGGLVLRELDVPYLHTWGNDWLKQAPISLLTRYYLDQDRQTPGQRRLVLISSVLPAPYNIGYQNLADEVIETINGHAIGSIADVLQALDDPQDGFHVIRLAPDSTRTEVVLDAATFDAATEEIAHTYQVPTPFRLPASPLPPGGGSCDGDF